MMVGLGVAIPVLLALPPNLAHARLAYGAAHLDRGRVGAQLLYAKIIFQTHQIQPPNRFTRGLASVRRAQRDLNNNTNSDINYIDHTKRIYASRPSSRDARGDRAADGPPA